MAHGKHGKPGTSGWTGKLEHNSMASRLTYLIGLGCLCSCAYVVVLLVSSHPCWTYGSPYCTDAVCSSYNSSGGQQVRKNLNLLGRAIMVNESSDSESKTHGQAWEGTRLDRIVFGIGASADMWTNRSQFLKLWWKPETRGNIFTDRDLGENWTVGDPPYRVSSDYSHIKYTHRKGRRDAIRISRIVSESFRLGLEDVDWFVMGDDDTFFFTENLVKVLSKYDHTKYYYIGSNSEDHIQNQLFSYNMAYGGGGFAISYPLAKALSEMQDDCLHRYTWLFGSDDRMKACMSELGVPLTKEGGFHQVDLMGDLNGFLAAHPLTPIVSLHHIEAIFPLFPGTTRAQGLKRLTKAIRVDPHNILQQSICYDPKKEWSFSVSWGYLVHVYKGFIPPHELEVPQLTFMSWHKRRESYAFPMNTRPRPREICDEPANFFMVDAKKLNDSLSYSAYVKVERPNRVRSCQEKLMPISLVDKIFIENEPIGNEWFQTPRRQCCRVREMNPGDIKIHVGACAQGERVVQ
ncbi:hypothetical protein MPTK1_1g04220 [Marchantia polymorpha subsp. ruderalis]|uniref:Uncharacterized protein n=2 Tax=Marchantia polymorpha TaxID=3197 RepID=A0AAF6ALD5_MARPO|nr:hypothetical protein MARPO_0005s0185 [Marchantia polymorpha]BBM97255.1 hypothetical protein Mp_1g04220 [Marchantia polymorpha subsp. ruderalis]|eukprot:PTQ48553.1 hypothetical protein MARPO_0005s0185 [Marchantia polymorpha]